MIRVMIVHDPQTCPEVGPGKGNSAQLRHAVKRVPTTSTLVGALKGWPSTPDYGVYTSVSGLVVVTAVVLCRKYSNRNWVQSQLRQKCRNPIMLDQ